LTPVETATGLKQLVVNQLDGSISLTIEYRQPERWEDSRTTGLVFMRTGTTLNGGLIDATPETTSSPWDSALQIGQKFYDAPSRTLYEFVSVEIGAATVKITRNADAPTPSRSTACQQGPTVTAPDGSMWTLGTLRGEVFDLLRDGVVQAGQGKQFLVRDGFLYVEGLEQVWFRYIGPSGW